MLDRVDPEVAKKALEQYPQFAKVGIQTLVDWKETVGKALVENGKMSTDMMREFDAVLSTLRTHPKIRAWMKQVGCKRLPL